MAQTSPDVAVLDELRELVRAQADQIEELREAIQELQGRAAPKPGLLNLRALRTKISVSRATLWRWIEAGSFPRPVYIRSRRYWDAAAVDAWVASNPRT